MVNTPSDFAALPGRFAELDQSVTLSDLCLAIFWRTGCRSGRRQLDLSADRSDGELKLLKLLCRGV